MMKNGSFHVKNLKSLTLVELLIIDSYSVTFTAGFILIQSLM